jgi:hypothetical protein
MRELTDPRDIRDWARRALSPPTLLFFAVWAALVASELKVGWIERLVGTSLLSTNAERPESGTIWEKGQKTRSAQSAVDKLAVDRESSQRTARNAGTLKEVVSGLAPAQGVMLSAEHFRELYQKLPQGFAGEIISPFELLRLAAEGRWIRTYLERSGDGVLLYLLDSGNEVLRQAKLNSAALDLLGRSGSAETRSLEDLPGFRGRIYAADRFFTILAAFPEDVRRSLVPQPERLLELAGQITRVGISDQAVSGFVEIGFEIRAGALRRVLLVQGQEWAVWRLHALLEGRRPGAGAAPQENWSPQ